MPARRVGRATRLRLGSGGAVPSGVFAWAVRRSPHIVVALVLLAFVVWRANLWQLSDDYEDISIWALLAAVFLNVPILGVYTLRGRFILGRLGHRVTFTSLFPISTLGIVMGTLTPAAAGDLLRTPFFKQHYDIPYADGVAAVVYERGFSLLALGMSTAVAAGWSTLPLPAAGAVSAGCVGLLVLAPPAAALALERFRRPLASIPEPGAEAGFMRRGLAALGRSLQSLLVLLRDGLSTAVVGFLSLAVFGLMAVQLWLVVEALGLRLSAAESWMAVGTSLLAATATLLPLGLGTMDATLAAVVGASENGFTAGAAAAVLLRATATLPVGLAAAGSYVYLMLRRPPS